MIAFDDRQWDTVMENYRLWRENKLGRAILPCMISGRDPGRSKPDVPLLAASNIKDFSITPEQIVDRYDYELSCLEFLGDAYPIMHMTQFGPGVVAAFLGAELEVEENTVWFRPKEIVPIEDLHFEYDENNIWLNRIKEIYRAGMKRWGGEVVMNMTDLGGILDILAVYRSTENLLTDLYDSPDQVKRLVKELQELWLRYFFEFADILKGSRGYTDWGGGFSPTPTYMLQSDFSYMISPDMFDEFVFPELESTASKLNNAFYHLDGVGQLAHLDTLLKSETISGIQWVPGSGAFEDRDWSEVYSKITAGGKKLQLYYSFEKCYDEVLEVIPKPDYLMKTPFVYPPELRSHALSKFGTCGTRR